MMTINRKTLPEQLINEIKNYLHRYGKESPSYLLMWARDNGWKKTW